MKRLLFLFLLCLSFPFGAAAQHGTFDYVPPSKRGTAPRQSGLKDKARYMGLTFGLVSGQLPTQGIQVDHGAKAGLTGGIVAGWRLFRSRHLFLETGLHYTGKGATLLGLDAEGEAERERIRIHYFELPLVVRGRIGAGRFGVCPFGGVFAALGFGGETRKELSGVADNSLRSDGFSRADAGLRVGLGLCYSCLRFDVGYDIGLVNIASRHLADFAYDQSPYKKRIRTGALTFALGVEF